MSSREERTYHTTSSAYSLPNDPTEHERLELQSSTIDAMMLNTRCHAALKSPSRILEVGSGTGSVTRHLAKTYPSAKVISNDLSPLPSTIQPMPDNVALLQGDFTTLVPTLEAESFDYIFSRMLVFGMSNFPSYISQCFSLLKSGNGYLELQEIDASTWFTNSNSNSSQEIRFSPEPSWVSEMRSIFLKKDLEIDLAIRLEQYVKDAGFVDVEVKEYRWMFGNWEGHPECDMISRVATTWEGKAMLGAYKRVCGEEKK